jgi:ribosomal protein L12E/L44/L45/RPP1/RPP2
MRPHHTSKTIAERAITKAATMARLQAEMNAANRIDTLATMLSEHSTDEVLLAIQLAAQKAFMASGGTPFPPAALLARWATDAQGKKPEQLFSETVSALMHEHFNQPPVL